MERLSQEARKRLDETVLLCSAMFYDIPAQLRQLHFDRPRHFAVFVTNYIPAHWRLRESLHSEDFAEFDAAERLAIVRSTLGRLIRRGELRRARIEVPVLIEMSTERRRRVEMRQMVCYWPATALDKLASV